jgi:hypothetical protein
MTVRRRAGSARGILDGDVGAHVAEHAVVTVPGDERQSVLDDDARQARTVERRHRRQDDPQLAQTLLGRHERRETRRARLIGCPQGT